MCLVLSSFCAVQTFAQQTSVSGVVKDAGGELIIGANVTVSGTSNGVITDLDGRFTLSVPNLNVTLAVSYVGYQPIKYQLKGNRSPIIVLQEDMLKLDEVIVVAYGTAKKSTFTGSASLIKSEEISKISGAGVMETLQGATAGVNITNNEGNPGGRPRVQIRGIANDRDAKASNPLYVVDGVPYDGNINSIAPADIEAMTILKDAAAASLYGSRAANGVVVITTKKGKAGATRVNFKAAWGTSDNAVSNPVKADPYQTLLYTWKANYNDGFYLHNMSAQEAGEYASSKGVSDHVMPRVNSKGETVYVTPFKSMPLDQYVLSDGKLNPNLEMVWDKSDYDWYGAVFSRKLRQDYSIDVSGATADNKTNYYISASHLNDNGYSIAQYYQRYSFRANATSQINNWLTMGGNLAYSYSRQNNSGSNRMLIFSNTLNSPWLRNADNTDWEYSLKTGSRMKDYGENNAVFFGIHSLDGMGGQGDYWNNPDDYNFHSSEDGMMTAHYFAEITLPASVRFKTNVNYDDITYTEYGYNSAIHGESQMRPFGVTVKTDGGGASRDNQKTTSLTWNNLLTWKTEIDDHGIDLLLGHEYYSRSFKQMRAGGDGIMNPGLFELSSTTKNWWTESKRDEYALLSFFGKAEYDFKDKYYLSASLRRDGSSCFHPSQRWGNFFSAGASWRLSQESFLNDISWLNNLSVRASYGTSGNDQIGKLYAYQSYYGSYNLFGEPGYRKSANGAENLHWEKNQQFNAAVDFSILNRISGTIEYYTRNSKDLLAEKDLPYSANAGAAKINTNLGNILNRGIELSLNAGIVQTKEFAWNVNANFTTLHNEVTSLAGGEYIFDVSRTTMKRAVGHSLFEHFIPKQAGVNPDNGRLQYWIQDGKGNWTTTENWGDVSLSRDGQFAGSAIPKGYGSLTNSFNYKGVDFSFMFYGSFGSYMYSYQLVENQSIRGGVSVVPDIVDGKVWMNPGDNAKFPRWSMEDRAYAGQNTNTDLFIVSNSFLRLRNLTLGYTLPSSLLKPLKLSNVRLYLTGDNLLTFSPTVKYHIDPESGLKGNDYNGNGDNDSGIQGARRVYMGGIQISF
ncbi:MAG: SusC/RagA family TonB-linked outer membrane protein [Tannerellaceae bacterium]|nr:SusC/RagA family TonB-linked outer membrane protein [Tannerellaceae bacterium]